MGERGKFLDKNVFLQALIENLQSRLENNVGLGTSDNLAAMLTDFEVVDENKWPTTVTSPWLDGEIRLKSLCNRFSLPYAEFQEGFRDFIDQPENIPESVLKLKGIVNSLPVSSADCERGFSTMNVICNDL